MPKHPKRSRSEIAARAAAAERVKDAAFVSGMAPEQIRSRIKDGLTAEEAAELGHVHCGISRMPEIIHAARECSVGTSVIIFRVRCLGMTLEEAEAWGGKSHPEKDKPIIPKRTTPEDEAIRRKNQQVAGKAGGTTFHFKI